MKRKDVLKELTTMSRNIGRPEYDYVIIAEGNTSAKIDDSSFYVKASGFWLSRMEEDGFVEVKTDTLMRMFEQESMSDEEIKQGLIKACVDYKGTMPSIETLIHAVCFSHSDARFICHTHPTAVNSIACSVNSKEALSGMLFPDEVNFCNTSVLFVEWAQPGLALARKVMEGIIRYKEAYKIPPRVIVMQNHGLVTLGEKRTQAENITAMFVKACRILIGTYSLGGPRFMTEKDLDRIFIRPYEMHRKEVILKKDT